MVSYTKHKDPFFGELIYKPEPTNHKYTYYNIRSDNTEFLNYVFKPFKTIVNWEYMIQYMGGNYNVIIRSVDMKNPDLPGRTGL